MVDGWDRRRILIWGKTRPEISYSYQEIVCTGGVFEDSRQFVRLYPIPLRYLSGDNRFKKYQWIEGDIQRADDKDPRPESYRIRPDTISLEGQIPTNRGDWSERESWIFHEQNLFDSVEALQEQRKVDHTSLGLVKPAEILDIRPEEVPQEDRDKYWERYEIATRQHELPFEPAREKQVKPLGPPDFRFKIEFRCADSECTGHAMSVLDWEVDALYHRQLGEHLVPELAAEDVIEQLYRKVCTETQDTYFFLGNIARWHHVFTIVGLWYPKLKDTSGGEQIQMFD